MLNQHSISTMFNQQYTSHVQQAQKRCNKYDPDAVSASSSAGSIVADGLDISTSSSLDDCSQSSSSHNHHQNSSPDSPPPPPPPQLQQAPLGAITNKMLPYSNYYSTTTSTSSAQSSSAAASSYYHNYASTFGMGGASTNCPNPYQMQHGSQFYGGSGMANNTTTPMNAANLAFNRLNHNHHHHHQNNRNSTGSSTDSSASSSILADENSPPLNSQNNGLQHSRFD